ncbi:hypothetical protein W97_04754 [Coniosporium apollinis CBS 100218]|uniref:BRCT domain-containing protein n=1 Tax=Coniosporium apollinis (strain CBS 100218) TaxID=1168221 RepID=R7YV18_CONA1|nr:uncharacterized protein W97_04754 [Coniosporium apollinis CBS 100218]EON65516.1 hypothetical protein W97_04754 [Coniosporium apollinis CBS 100218]
MQSPHAPSISKSTYPPHSPTITTTKTAFNPTRAASPTRHVFDAWNSSTGHQRAENRLSGSTSWRVSRNLKLSAQYAGGASGGTRVADTVGAGSEGFGVDGREESGGWGRGASGLRGPGQRSLLDCFAVTKGVKSIAVAGTKDGTGGTPAKALILPKDSTDNRLLAAHASADPQCEAATQAPPQPQIFRNLTVFINGSTAPTISDHKLKHLLASHGARLSIALGRRSVTHVILGTTAGGGGAGGGLAGSKIQKEVARVGGKGVKFVGVEWVIESIEAGKRLPEARFANLKLAAKGQESVLGVLRRDGGAERAHEGIRRDGNR